ASPSSKRPRPSIGTSSASPSRRTPTPVPSWKTPSRKNSNTSAWTSNSSSAPSPSGAPSSRQSSSPKATSFRKVKKQSTRSVNPRERYAIPPDQPRRQRTHFRPDFSDRRRGRLQPRILRQTAPTLRQPLHRHWRLQRRHPRLL